MSSWRTRRKLTYLTGALVLLLLIVAPAAFLLIPRASCTDFIQNGDESGVDCGGSCELSCRPLPRAAIIEWARPFMVGKGVASAVAYITNPNREHYALRVPYIFKLYDAGGVLLIEQRGRADFYPQASIPIFAGTLNIGNKVATRALFSFLGEPEWQGIEAARVPRLSVQDQVFVDAPPRLSATIVNDSLTSYSQVAVTAVLFDQNDNAFAASETVIEVLEKESEAPVVFTWPTTFALPPARILVYPKPPLAP